VEVREDLEEIEGGVGGVGSVSRTVGAFRSRCARARPSSIESARFAIERQLNERLSRVGRALGLAGTTEGVKNRHWGKMTYISHVPRVRVLHDGKRRPAAPRRSLCSRPGRPRTSYGFQRGPLRRRDHGKPLFAATKSGQSHKTGQHRHGGRSKPLARLRAAERPSYRCHRRRDPSRLRRCVSGARRLVRERTPRFFVRLVPCFPAAHLRAGL
jgi:hypothetical protein